MIIGFILGVITGAGIGVLIMAVLSLSKDDNIYIVHEICNDCKHKEVPADMPPCKDCGGDNYEWTGKNSE